MYTILNVIIVLLCRLQKLTVRESCSGAPVLTKGLVVLADAGEQTGQTEGQLIAR